MSSPTYGDLWRMLAQQLPSPFEARQLFGHITGLPGYRAAWQADMPLPAGQMARGSALARRRREGEPLQYLLEEWEFYGLPFYVGEGVLIPRGDTETLVEAALEAAKSLPTPRVTDLCAGSGAVAVAVAHERPDARVAAVELSEAAFSYLERNIARNGVAVAAVRGDIHTWAPAEPQHIITANPPYIPTAELAGLQREVGHEPATALDGGADGLDFYRAIARRYRRHLLPGGTLCLEVGAGQSEAVGRILAGQGFADIQARADLGGIPRVVTATA